MNNYLKYADILRRFKENKLAIKTQIFNGNTIQAGKKKEAFAILMKCHQFYDAVIEICTDLMENKENGNINNKYLFCVLVIERFFSNKQKINGGGKIKQLIESNQKFIRQKLNLPDSSGENGLTQMETTEKNLLKKKIYIRLIRNRINKQKFMEECQISDKEAVTDKDLSELLCVDYHIYQGMISRNPGFISDTRFVIQSKSSALPAYILGSAMDLDQGNFDIIDSCSAPGNKTMQLAAYQEIRKKGNVIAFEKSQDRFKILADRIKSYKYDGVVKCRNQNFLDVDIKDKSLKNVKYILIDPTCSSSGMLSNVSCNAEKTADLESDMSDYREFCNKRFLSLAEKEQKRITQISQFQLKILQKAAQFEPRYMIYSTCSIYEIENESVLHNFTKTNPEYAVENILPTWNDRGFATTQFPDGSRSIRVIPFRDYSTDGFYVALLRRAQ